MTEMDLHAAVLDADRQRYQAMIQNDAAALDRWFADGLVYMHSTGATDSKASLLAALKARKFSFKQAETSDTKVRAYGDVGVLNGKVRMVVEVAGTDHHAFSAFTTVWVRTSGSYRLVHWQSTPLPKA